jgi:hypothetical protein
MFTDHVALLTISTRVVVFALKPSTKIATFSPQLAMAGGRRAKMRPVSRSADTRLSPDDVTDSTTTGQTTS